MMCNKGKIFLGVLMLVFLSADQLHAQTWSEWFSQKKMQKKYLIEQIAALKLYATYLKKGYEMGSSGLNLIRDAGKGELDLHSAFFSALKTVSPLVKKNVRIAEILEMQITISKIFSDLSNLQNLSDANHRYIDLVSSNLLEDCTQDLEALLLVITSGRVELTDDERMLRIDQLYQNMQQKKIFTARFSALVQSLDRDRLLEIKNIKEMEVRYGNE
ncbi:hypothetical protein QFZ20_002253 [Flavobacterium sp. W4I14]|nr:hypothetical protein [Flavobacterium sp. W4I14]